MSNATSCKAFQNPNTRFYARGFSAPLLGSEVLRIGAQAYKIVWYGEKREVYRIEPDGLEMFEGYAPEVLPKLIRRARAA